MPLYKFYRIIPKDTTQTDCYIGHTIQPLRKRFTGHCQKSNDCSSKVLFERYGKEGLEIILIHELELPNTEYARREERRLWEEVKEQAVNKERPWTSNKEKEEQNKQGLKKWYEANREYAIAQRMKYHGEHKEQNKQSQKKYNDAHKEQRKQYNKQYYEANKKQKKTTPPPDASSDTPQTQPLE